MTKVKGNHKDYTLVVDSGVLHSSPVQVRTPTTPQYTGISPLQRDFSSLGFFPGSRPRQRRAAADAISALSLGMGSQPLERGAEHTYPHRRDVGRGKEPCFATVRPLALP